MEKIEKILKYLKVFLFVKIFLFKESIWVLEDLTYLSNRYMKNWRVFDYLQTLRKSEMMCHDLETRLVESEKACEETREKLAKLEKIREFIYELSSGKKKLFEE